MSKWNAGATPLGANPGTLPDMTDALLNWFQPLTAKQVTKTTVNFQLVETVVTQTSQGVIQPFKPKQLSMKPEGQRAWSWFMLHCLPSLNLQTDMGAVIQGVPYRVMEKLDYKEYGYIQYALVQDYTGGT